MNTINLAKKSIQPTAKRTCIRRTTNTATTANNNLSNNQVNYNELPSVQALQIMNNRLTIHINSHQQDINQILDSINELRNQLNPTNDNNNLLNQSNNEIQPKYESTYYLIKLQAISNLRELYYENDINILKFSENFLKQISILNRENEIIGDELCRLFYIGCFKNYPYYETILIQYEEECKRNKQSIDLNKLINYANIIIMSSNSRANEIDHYKKKQWKNRSVRYTNNRRKYNQHYKNKNVNDNENESNSQDKFNYQNKRNRNNKFNNHNDQDELNSSDDEPTIVKSLKYMKYIK